MSSDAAYYRAREEEERRLAAAAVEPSIARIHLDFVIGLPRHFPRTGGHVLTAGQLIIHVDRTPLTHKGAAAPYCPLWVETCHMQTVFYQPKAG